MIAIAPFRDCECSLQAMNDASAAYWDAHMAGRRGEALDKLNREDDRLREAYLKSLFAPVEPVAKPANTTRVIFAADGYDMDDSAEIAFEVDDFLGPVSQPVATPRVEVLPEVATYLYAPMNRPAMYGTVPADFAVVSEKQTEFTPYGTISYPAPLDALTAWKYELKNLFEGYRVGDTVQWVESGKVCTGEIYQIDDKWSIWSDEYTKLPFWALHLTSQPARVATPPQPAPAMGLQHGQQRTGRVSSYDTEHGFGYIASKDHTFYFQTGNLQHVAMPIAEGDTVTFTVWYLSSNSRPRAASITKPGYVAPVSTAQEFERRHAETRKASEERRKAIRAEQLAKRQQRGA